MAAKKGIMGLTVEIGGDTTKLGKALENVDKKSKSLSGELRQINQLLKLDPGNADLLAQKQKVLADAVATTSERLDKLKEAEKQVQKQFEKGEASEEQVRKLQREIIATEKKLESYEKAVRETTEAQEKLGDGGDELEETGNDAKKAAKKVDDFADSAEKADKSSGNLGSTLASAAKTGLAAIAGAATAAIGALVGAAEATREYRTEMGKLDTAFTTAGHSSAAATKTYETLQGILGETDQAVEASNHLAKLCKNEDELAKMTNAATGVYATFGDSLPIENLTEAANETAKTGALTGGLADALNWAGVSEDEFQAKLDACSSEQERQSLIIETLNGLYSDAADKYRETNGEIIRANQANDNWMQSLAAIGGAIEPIITDIKTMGASLLSDLVPGVQKLAEAFRGLLSGDMNAASGIGEALSGLVTGLLDKLVNALPAMAQTAVSLITTLASAIMQQLPTILSVGGQIIGQLLTGIAQNLPGMVQGALNAIGNFVTGLQTYLPLVLSKGGEILSNLSQGISQKLPGLVSQALDIIMRFAQTLYDNAPQLIKTGFDVLTNLVRGIMDSLPTLLSKAPEIISKFANIINDNFPTILKKGVELIGEIIKGIIQAIPTLVKNIPKIITAIVDVWEAFNWLQLGKKAITLLKDGIMNMVGAVKSAGKSVMDGTVNALKNLPQNLLNLGKSAVQGLGNAIKAGVSNAKTAAKAVLDAAVNTFKGLPSKMLSVGKDLVKGLWNGISDMSGWIINKIKGFGDSVLSGIKSFFGIKSPSRVMRDEVGKMLPAGMAEGIEAGEDSPMAAMRKITDGVLGAAETEMNGLALERNLRSGTAFSSPANMETGNGGAAILASLDRLYERLGRLQIVLDTGTLVGETIDKIDAGLGDRQLLRARGV